METFSIVDKIDVNKLNTKIAEFVYREDMNRTYLQTKRRLKH